MTIVGPLLLALLLLSQAWLSKLDEKEHRLIAVIDKTLQFEAVIQNTEFVKFHYLNNEKVNNFLNKYKHSDYYALIVIPESFFDDETQKVLIYSDAFLNSSLKMHIANSLEKELERVKLHAKGISEDELNSIKANIAISTVPINKKGDLKNKSLDNLRKGAGIVGSILIYFFIFMFSVQVMKGVIEEKVNRIVEIIVSSVKPFQLMMGKIIGVGLVGLTQFVIWLVLSLAVVSITSALITEDIPTQITQLNGEKIQQSSSSSSLQYSQTIESDTFNKLKNSFNEMNVISLSDLFNLIGTFLFFFIGGYMLYSSMFAAIGSAVESETDTQQFILPVTIPLIISFIAISPVIENPNGQIAFWLSIIPFTSPIIMMVRIPFGDIPLFPDIIMSVSILIISFVLMTYIAGKIYRVGILNYGKKITYKDLLKWAFNNDK